MPPFRHRLFNHSRLLLILGLLLSVGFLVTSFISYEVSKRSILEAIVEQSLPLTSSNIYSEIQKDLVRPVLISSTMAHDTFLRRWVLQGEANVEEMAHYLREIRQRYGAFASFFVSERSGTYYTGDGILKQISPDEPRDAWYYRTRALTEDYEINVDPDLANQDALTIFINYRVYDFDGNYIGATGIGLTVDAVRRLVSEHQQRFNRKIYFVDKAGKVVLVGNSARVLNVDLHASAGIGPQLARILAEDSGSYQYADADGNTQILQVNYLPELKWYLFVEQGQDAALTGIQRTLWINILISLLITAVVILLAHVALRNYQHRIEEMATIDKLTGLLNRNAFTMLMKKLLADYKRDPQPMAFLLADIDFFKQINDRHGHLAGDNVLAGIAKRLLDALRESDLVVRWGGEELLILLRHCDLSEALRIAESLRRGIGEEAFATNGQAIPVTISIGVTEYQAGESTEQAVSRADAALYQAKNAGRNRVCVAPEA
ncbi:sensor domain-containing diguanylate cyclase [Denitromonas halophila]|uniref:diguanylate cyclase n=1 Tax=Denitromonas halophila TaxID=1629404 RepID=A0A557QF98_9RHOO|nr:sensor domain-containing diguanylate cyclase [Denitromonas halophila]TVO51589.1 GGDEF domain-containing protein [Denitromonas halophila]